MEAIASWDNKGIVILSTVFVPEWTGGVGGGGVTIPKAGVLSISIVD